MSRQWHTIDLDGLEWYKKDLIRLPYQKRIRIIKDLISSFIGSDYNFLRWKSISESIFEI